MPSRRSKNVRPPEFVSDTEDAEEHLDNSPSVPPAESMSICHDAKLPFAPRGDSEVSCLETKQERRSTRADPPPVIDNNNSGLGQLAQLVSILHQANTGFKGRVDDTGRFELQFQVDPDYSRSEVVPAIHELSSTSSIASQRSARKKIAWKRPHQP